MCASPVAAPGSGLSQKDYLRQQIEAAVEAALGMQLWGPAWDAAVAADPTKAVLTGALWPHSSPSNKAYAALCKAKLKDEIAGHGAPQTGSWVRLLEIFARVAVTNCTKFYHDDGLLSRVVAGLDFYQVMQGSNGGFSPRANTGPWVGAPNRINGTGCLEGCKDSDLDTCPGHSNPRSQKNLRWGVGLTEEHGSELRVLLSCEAVQMHSDQ